MRLGVIAGGVILAVLLLAGGYYFFFYEGAVEKPAEATAVTEPATAEQETTASTEKAEDPSVPTFSVVRVDKDGSTVAAGRALPGANVEVKANGEVVATAKADDNGEWVAILDQPLKSGDIQITLTARNPDGSEKNSVQVVSVSVPESADEQALVVMSEPGKASKVLQGPGVASASGELVLETVDYDENGNLIISGRAKPGTTLRIYAGAYALGEAVAGDDGRWELRPSVELAPGKYALRVDQIGADGNVSARVEVPFQRGRPEDVVAALKAGQVVIQPGNNLWSIARKLYGSGFRYTLIYKANKGQIRDPNLIYPGQIFDTPGAAPSNADLPTP